MEIKNVSVIGAGTMGNGIAHVFAQTGFAVTLIDVNASQLEKAISTISKNLDRQIAKGSLTEDQKSATLNNISTSTSIAEGVKNAQLVVEAATENVNLKLEIFKQMDASAPSGCILATNTSSISITKIAAVTQRPEAVIGMHFMNPVPIMKLVEVIRGYSTSDEVTATIFEVSRKLDKVPVEVNDYPGFVANRILMPMINEAVYCVMEGVGTPADHLVDQEIVKQVQEVGREPFEKLERDQVELGTHAEGVGVVEVMANLDKVPAKGALIVVTWPKVKDGLGFPARAFAILP